METLFWIFTAASAGLIIVFWLTLRSTLGFIFMGILGLCFVGFFAAGLDRHHMKKELDEEVKKTQDMYGGKPATASQLPERPQPKVQSVRILVPPCATPGKRDTWSPAVSPSGMRKQMPSGDYQGEYEDPKLVNYTGFGEKVTFRWYCEDDTIPLMAVANDDYRHPLDPIPGRIETPRTIGWEAIPTDVTPAILPAWRTIRWGSKVNRSTWVVAIWISKE
jgi:hypothetical protein